MGMWRTMPSGCQLGTALLTMTEKGNVSMWQSAIFEVGPRLETSRLHSRQDSSCPVCVFQHRTVWTPTLCQPQIGPTTRGTSRCKPELVIARAWRKGANESCNLRVSANGHCQPGIWLADLAAAPEMKRGDEHHEISSCDIIRSGAGKTSRWLHRHHSIVPRMILS